MTLNIELGKVTSDFSDMNLLERLPLEAFPPEEYLAPAEIMEMLLKTDMNFVDFEMIDEQVFNAK